MLSLAILRSSTPLLFFIICHQMMPLIYFITAHLYDADIRHRRDIRAMRARYRDIRLLTREERRRVIAVIALRFMRYFAGEPLLIVTILF